MALDPKKLLKAFELKLDGMEERYTGYKKELLHTVGDIVLAEREHMVRHTSVQQTIVALCERLGALLHQNSSNDS